MTDTLGEIFIGSNVLPIGWWLEEQCHERRNISHFLNMRGSGFSQYMPINTLFRLYSCAMKSLCAVGI